MISVKMRLCLRRVRKERKVAMERLTVRNSEGIGVLKQPFECERCGDLQWSLPDLGNGSPIDRLAKYEDLEEIFRSKMTDSSCDFLKDKEEFARWIDRNKWIAKRCDEYAKAEEQRKLLKLPCAVGDTVYRVHKGTKLSPNRVYECKVVGVKQEYNAFSVKLHANINEETYSIWVDNWFDKCQIGHEFFLAEEEAEAVFKEL